VQLKHTLVSAQLAPERAEMIEAPFEQRGRGNRSVDAVDGTPIRQLRCRRLSDFALMPHHGHGSAAAANRTQSSATSGAFSS
jgi:hypothetical protein